MTLNSRFEHRDPLDLPHIYDHSFGNIKYEMSKMTRANAYIM